MTSEVRLCCLCGIMCDAVVDRHSEGDTDTHVGREYLRPFANRCPRVASWLQGNPKDFLAAGGSWVAANNSLLARCQTASKTLFWIDSADVECTRAAVALCQRIKGTIHIGHSTGALIAKRTVINEGWLGTTLPEVATHAELVVTLGSGLLDESPLLAERFFDRPNAAGPVRWWHIDEFPLRNLQSSGVSTRMPDNQLFWPRRQWLQEATNLLLELRRQSNSSASDSPASAKELDKTLRESRDGTSSTLALAQQLVQSKNSVWLWHNSEFSSELDELLISRLHAIARELTQTSRCSLLNLESNIGRLTADECLLWLTGCSGHATWDGQAWRQFPAYCDFQLSDWRREFDNIVLIRAAPVADPLPDLDVDLIIAGLSECERNRDSERECIAVNLTGSGYSGYFSRGDRGSILKIGKRSAPGLPTAAELLWSCLRDYR